MQENPGRLEPINQQSARVRLHAKTAQAQKLLKSSGTAGDDAHQGRRYIPRLFVVHETPGLWTSPKVLIQTPGVDLPWFPGKNARRGCIETHGE